MADLNYGYEVTIQQNATFDPTGAPIENQWQRQIPGNTNWENVGSGANTYKIGGADRDSKIRLRQSLNGTSAYSNELHVTNETFSPTLTHFGSYYVDNGKWYGGVLAPNGKIYGIPYNSSTILEINPDTLTTETFGSLDTKPAKWAGGVLASNGKIYGFPSSSSTILEIDPGEGVNSSSPPTVSTFGDFGEVADKWLGGVVAPNGKIYGFPQSRKDLLEIDPISQTTKTFELPALGGMVDIRGGVLAPNGRIYCFPHNAPRILEIDPQDGIDGASPLSAQYIGGSDDWRARKYWGGALAPNGKIYGAPWEVSYAFELSPGDGVGTINPPSISTFGSFGTTSSYGKWASSVLAPDGKIYSCRWGYSKFLQITPGSNTTEFIGDYSSRGDWSQLVLAKNGKLYGIPYGIGQALEIDVGAPEGPIWSISGLPNNTLDPLSPYFNKY